MKKLLSLALTLILVISIVPVAATNTMLPADVVGHWSADIIASAIAVGILTGDAETGFIRPDDSVTRAEFITMINRTFGLSAEGDLSAYSDYDESAWYADEISTAVAFGFYNGTESNGQLYINGNTGITREAAFTLICRVIGLNEISGASDFIDDDDVSPWARGSITAMQQAGYLFGYATDNGYAMLPQNSLSRAEAAWILMNVVDVGSDLPTATVNGKTVYAHEFNFYYENYYSNFDNLYGSLFTALGLDINKSFKTQKSYLNDGSTWHDYFVDNALRDIHGIYTMVAEAKAAGVTLNAQSKAQLAREMDSIEEAADNSAYFTDSYLRYLYGGGMNLAEYERIMSNNLLAQQYAAEIKDGYSFTEQELSAYYDEHADEYDVVDFCVYSFNEGEMSDEDAITLINRQAYETQTVSYNYLDTSMNFTERVAEWLFDPLRTAGDTCTIDDGDTYALLFMARYREDYATVNARHIMFSFDLDDFYAVPTEKLDAATKARADAVYAEWEESDKTEAAFAALAEMYSDDSYSETGLYTGIYKGQMVDAFNDWVFAEGRRIGDYNLIKTEYGYHIMYFSGMNLPRWAQQVDAALRDEMFHAWQAETIAIYNVEILHSFEGVGMPNDR